MTSFVQTVAFRGISVIRVDVQIHLSNGLPSFTIVGLPDKTVAESRERIRASFSSLNLSFPSKKIIVNLAPADFQKEGSHYDLPIALGILVAMEVIDAELLSQYVVLGELGLDGSLSNVSGVLAASLDAFSQNKGIICPKDVAKEAVWAGSIDIVAAPTLKSVIDHLKGETILLPPEIPKLQYNPNSSIDFKEIKGHKTIKRALEVAAVGRHHVMMMGPPGCGKSLLASALSGIIPPLTPQEALDVSIIYSLAGLSPTQGLVEQRPYRSPHHSASLPSLVGGGHRSKPGEISLAHRGILFMDEFSEFNRSVLEALRQPLETGEVTISRANAHMTYPAEFQLIAAMNPCRCGFFGTIEKQCGRAPVCAQDYQQKISGPLWDRFDMRLYVQALSKEDLASNNASHGDDSQTINHRIQSALQFQYDFQTELGVKIQSNSMLKGKILTQLTPLSDAASLLLAKALDKLLVSGRGYDRILRLSRSLADLEQSPVIDTHHLAEALSYRDHDFSS
jgi:magnesium chelatase family protein